MLAPFTTSFNASLIVGARPERLTGDAGAVLVREVIERTGIIEWMTARLHDPRQPHLVTYPLAELLRTMLVLFAQGWRDQDDADGLRLDPALRCAVAGARGTTPLAEGACLASQPTLSRLLDILTLEANQPVLRQALAEIAARRLGAERGGRQLRRLTIDVDGLPVEVHGTQPGSAWNGHYQQRMYHPIIACAAETGDMLDARLRPGNAHTAEGARLRPRPGRPARRHDVPGRHGPHGRRLPRGEAAFRPRSSRHALCGQDTQQPGARPHGRPASQAPTRTAAGRATGMVSRDGLPGRCLVAGPLWSRARCVVLVVLERPGDLLLEHFWLLTSISAAAVPAGELLAHHRQRGTAEGHFGELMDVWRPRCPRRRAASATTAAARCRRCPPASMRPPATRCCCCCTSWPTS